MRVSRQHLLKGAATAVVAFLAFGVVTALVPNPVFDRMVDPRPADYVFLTATAVLAGAYVVQRELMAAVPGDACAYAGGIGGFLAFGCPICNHVLLVLFSSSAIMTYFDPLRTYIGAVSVAVFAGVLVYRQRQLQEAEHADEPDAAGTDV